MGGSFWTLFFLGGRGSCPQFFDLLPDPLVQALGLILWKKCQKSTLLDLQPPPGGQEGGYLLGNFSSQQSVVAIPLLRVDVRFVVVIPRFGCIYSQPEIVTYKAKKRKHNFETFDNNIKVDSFCQILASYL